MLTAWGSDHWSGAIDYILQQHLSQFFVCPCNHIFPRCWHVPLLHSSCACLTLPTSVVLASTADFVLVCPLNYYMTQKLPTFINEDADKCGYMLPLSLSLSKARLDVDSYWVLTWGTIWVTQKNKKDFLMVKEWMVATHFTMFIRTSKILQADQMWVKVVVPVPPLHTAMTGN